MRYFYLFCIGIIIFFSHCDSEEEQMVLDPEILKHNIAKDVEIIYSDSAKVSLIVNGPKMVTKSDEYNNNEVIFPEGIKITFLNKQGVIEGTLKADRGVQQQHDKKILFYGNVEVTGKKEEQLYTQELIWDQTTNKILSKRLVKIVSPTDTLEGIGIEANQDMSEWHMIAPFGPMNVKN